jgi:two-component system, response regulator, stage 0 sporulation protein F
MLRVLYIDDEPINLSIFSLAFRNDFKIITSESPTEALDIFDSQEIDLVVTDLKMPMMDGIELAREIKMRDPEKKCILLTAYYQPDLLNDPAIKSLFTHCVVKPFKRNEMRELIHRTCA